MRQVIDVLCDNAVRHFDRAPELLNIRLVGGITMESGGPFLELRDNTGDEQRRTHNLNLANWVPDLFMKRVEADQTWSLFDPKDVPELVDSWGEDFERVYEQAEADGRGRLVLRRVTPQGGMGPIVPVAGGAPARSVPQMGLSGDDLLLVWPDPFNVRPDRLLQSLDAVLGDVGARGGQDRGPHVGVGAGCGSIEFVGQDGGGELGAVEALAGAHTQAVAAAQVVEGARPLVANRIADLGLGDDADAVVRHVLLGEDPEVAVGAQDGADGTVEAADAADGLLAVMDQALASDGQAVIATFGPDGPLKCSGLDTVRYSAGELAAELGSRWRLVEQRAEAHRTPLGREQHFGYGRFARAAMRGAETR